MAPAIQSPHRLDCWCHHGLYVMAFVTACMVCVQNKTPRQAPGVLLQPLPVPHGPWSLDFVTGLLPSDGNTTILTVVDRFSKAAHYIPLPKLPSAKKTAQSMVQYVFRIHGLPVDMVSAWVLSSCPGSGRRVVGQPVLWVGPSVQRPFGVSQSRSGDDSLLPHLRQPHHLEPATRVG